jgi:hypothetical protein
MQSSMGVWEPRHSCNMSHDDRSYSHRNELTGDQTRLLCRVLFFLLGVSRLPKLPIRDRFTIIEGYHVGYSSDARVAPN